MELDKYFKNVEFLDEIWSVPTKNNNIFYPEKGNSNFSEIEENSFWYRHRNNCIEQVIKLFPPQKFVFDIGGGNGFVSKAIKNTGNIPVIVEPDINGILNAQKRGFKNLVNARFQDLDIVKGSIPSIGLFDVLEHIENDEFFLKKLNNALSEKGKLYISVPAFNFLWSNEDTHDGHFRRYTNKSLKKLLVNNNFSICYATYIFSFLPLPIFLLRTIPFLLKKQKKEFDKEQEEHKAGAFYKIFNLIFDKELSFIKHKKRIAFGGSILIVAEKK